MCQALLAAAQEQLKSNQPQCLAPRPAGDERFSTIEWQALDPAGNLDIIKMNFAWNAAYGNYFPDSQELTKKMRTGPDEFRALVEPIWAKYKFNIEELMANGGIELETAQVGFPDTAEPMQVYRTTLLFGEPWPGVARWRVPSCDSGNDERAGHYWDFFYPRRWGGSRRWDEFVNLNTAAGTGPVDLVVWNGQSYPAHLSVPAVDFYVIKQEDMGNYVAQTSTLCQIHVRWE